LGIPNLPRLLRVSSGMPKSHKYDVYARGFATEEILGDREEIVKKLLEMAAVSRESGFQGFLPTLLLDEHSTRPRSAARVLWDACQKAQRLYGLRCYPRCHVKVDRVGTAKRIIREIRRMCAILSIEVSTRDLYAFACRDRRVDIVTIGSKALSALQKGVVKYAQLRGKFFELVIGYLFEGGIEDQIISRLASYKEIASLTLRKGIPLLLSSGPQKVYNPYSYRVLLSFADAVLEVPADHVARSMGSLLELRIRENIEKIVGKRPAEGVFIEE